MPDAAWKATERIVARRLGGRRAGPLGREGADVVHPLFACECKETLPARRARYIDEWIAQAVRAALPGQLPLVVWHLKGQRHDEDLVIMRLRDFEAWSGPLVRPKRGECGPG